ncbi:MAG: type II CAAX endopeptidase family protein [Anaerolineales bacterium]|jgi:membrane protease YdiL (CAAX protease family)
MDTTLLRPIWARIFRRAWFLNLVLFLILAGIRCWGLFGPTETRMLVMLNFLLMWCFPFVFYSRSGRRAVGLNRIQDFRWLYRGMFFAALASLIIFFIGYELYGLGADNWYISLRDSFDIDAASKQLPRVQLFLLYTVPAIVFSPVGEEFFFRGMIHAAVEKRLGGRAATVVNAAAFSSVHLLHHGIRQASTGLPFTWVSGALWFMMMMGLSWFLTQCRTQGGSIWPAVAAHAAFNLVTNVTIFWVLL